MSAHRLPESWSGRLRWVLAEGALVAAVFVFWVLVAAALSAALAVLARVIAATGLRELRFAYEVVQRADFVWASVVPLTAATTTLYVLARAGSILVDRYRRVE